MSPLPGHHRDRCFALSVPQEVPAIRAGQPRRCLTPRLVLHEDGSSSILALGSIIGSQNELLHGFFSWDRLKLQQGREPKMKRRVSKREQEGAGGSSEGVEGVVEEQRVSKGTK